MDSSGPGVTGGTGVDSTTPVTPAPGYETRDANTSGVLLFLAILAATLALVLLFTWGLFRKYSVSINNQPPDSPFTGVREVPAAPRLQVTPREDLERILADQQQKLGTYGWEDRQAGTVHIPIERAMDLLIQKGLPVAGSAKSGEPTDASATNGIAAGSGASPRNAAPGDAGIDVEDKGRVPGIASAPAGPTGK